MTSSERESTHPAPDFDARLAEEPLPEPVFVDESGLRGRLLRGLGWPVSVVGAVLAVAMGGSLIGVQADAPAMEIPPQSAQPERPAPSPSPSPSASGSASPSVGPSSSRSAPARPSSSAGSKTTVKPTGQSTKHP
ncbi:hypothetical protein [Kitasatospora sp. NPDC004531]